MCHFQREEKGHTGGERSGGGLLVLDEVQVPEKEGGRMRRGKGWAGSGPGGAAAPCCLTIFGLSLRRICCTESPTPHTHTLHLSGLGEEGCTAGMTQHDKKV